MEEDPGCQHHRFISVRSSRGKVHPDPRARSALPLPPLPPHYVCLASGKAHSAPRHQIQASSPCSILLIASISAHRTNYPQPQAAYNASKAALLSLKSSLAAEWARHGIRVNSISPGYMDTVLNAGAGLAHARNVWAERNPTGRLGFPEELTGAVVLLCGAAGSYITGADLVIDGGQICF